MVDQHRFMGYEPVHRTILIVDIEDYEAADRTDQIRVALRKALDNLLCMALAQASITESNYRRADTGDGVVVLLSAEVSKLRLIDPFVPRLAAGVKAYNHGVGTEARMRLRVVVHAGEVIADEEGYFGEDLNHAFRLLDSMALRRQLAATDAPLALIVSQAIHDGIIKHHYGGLDPSSYHPVRVTAKKDQRLRAWVWTPPPRSSEIDDDAWLVERIQRAFAHEEPTTEWSAILHEDAPAVVAQPPPAEWEWQESGPWDDQGYKFLASAHADEYLRREFGLTSERDRDEIVAKAVWRYLEGCEAATVRSSKALAWQTLTRVALSHLRRRVRQGAPSELSGERSLAWNASHGSASS